MIEQNYQGYLLAAHPRKVDAALEKSVILIMDHDDSGALGLQINKAFDNNISFDNVMRNVGLTCPEDQPLYTGGLLSTNRINVIHSLDWYSRHTTKLSNNLGVSHDVSVLAAISKGEGPEYFRVVAGYHKWLPGYLEGEILGEEPWDVTNTWGFVPATIETVFELDGIEQWYTVLSESSKLQVATWF